MVIAFPGYHSSYRVESVSSSSTIAGRARAFMSPVLPWQYTVMEIEVTTLVPEP